MWESVQAPIVFGLIAAFATTIGLIAVARSGAWSERNASLVSLAAAGMLITLTLLHIAPEAIAYTDRAPMFILSGFLGGLIMNYAVRALFPQPINEAGSRAEAFTPIIAIAIHSFIDGMIYSVTFAASFTAGMYAALGLILHEFPEGVIAFAILKRHGFKSSSAFFWAFAAAAATTPLGVMASAPIMSLVTPETIGALFAISAGLLLFVATGPLMSPMRDAPGARNLIALSAGVALAIALVIYAPLHGEDEDHDGHSHAHHIHGAQPCDHPFTAPESGSSDEPLHAGG